MIALLSCTLSNFLDELCVLTQGVQNRAKICLGLTLVIDTNKKSVTKYAKHKLNSPTKWKAWKYKLRPPDTTPCERVLVCLVANCWTGHWHLFEEKCFSFFFFLFSSTSFSFSGSTTTNLPAEVCQREAWSHGPCKNIIIIIEISNNWCSCSILQYINL